MFWNKYYDIAVKANLVTVVHVSIYLGKKQTYCSLYTEPAQHQQFSIFFKEYKDHSSSLYFVENIFCFAYKMAMLKLHGKQKRKDIYSNALYCLEESFESLRISDA